MDLIISQQIKKKIYKNQQQLTQLKKKNQTPNSLQKEAVEHVKYEFTRSFRNRKLKTNDSLNTILVFRILCASTKDMFVDI